ncbi:MAG: amidohydrolase family protein [Arcobacteraceae bacterium]
MSRVFDSHIHFNMKASDIVNDFKKVASELEGFILILNTDKEKQLFLNFFLNDFSENYPLSAIALNYELFDSEIIDLLVSKNIKLGIKLHPRLSNITVNNFKNIYNKMQSLKFSFIIIDCFYYGSNLVNHINLELSIYIAKKFSNIKVLLAHGGGHKVLEYMLYTRDLKNIYYDFSFSLAYLKDSSIWVDFIKFFKFNENRVLFGSDYPEFKIKYMKSCYDEVIKKALNKNNSELIEKLNYKEFLEIE